MHAHRDALLRRTGKQGVRACAHHLQLTRLALGGLQLPAGKQTSASCRQAQPSCGARAAVMQHLRLLKVAE